MATLPVKDTTLHETSRQAKKRFMREAIANRSSSDGTRNDRSSELLPAFDRAIAAARRNAQLNPEDQHQVWALNKGKKAVLESLKHGDDITLGALHTLKGVGHWVAQQVREHLIAGDDDLPPQLKRARTNAPPPTPESFTWWYLGHDGEYTEEQNSAESTGPLGSQQYRVCIRHSSGRMEKAWLPDAKAPPRSPAVPPDAASIKDTSRSVRKSTASSSSATANCGHPTNKPLSAEELRQKRMRKF